MDARLPEAAKWRYRREVGRRGAARSGVIVVMIGALAVIAWTGTSAPVDLRTLTGVPSALGFTMFSPKLVHGQSGYPAPPFANVSLACDPTSPTFALGMASLKGRLQDSMGDPTECEHPVDATGNTIQATTTGVAAYLAASQTVTFTDGTHRWALTAGTLLVSIEALADRVSP
jgi:hypothetical protein